ncbi:ATP-dependent RNA helicase Atu1833 [hydrothermal vent metagenome]|uniref:ATP-dependent RNA helicase Atu1833 n=1 Tax=hydrothermal vent metagenome TaxID=652676 RepID=A0A3B0RSR3_9ZZZZ
MKFDQLGLSEKVLDAVTAAGFETATPIQAGAIPPALARKDVLGLAQTGSGKTAAFALPMLCILEKGRARARIPRTLILEPTRELAAQVADAFVLLGKNHKINMALLIGGVSFADQNAIIDRGADVLIATPGRLIDHIERGKLMLNGIEVLVVDEADRMLDMGFIPDIERICKMLPITRQTMFFSATMPPEIKRITNQFLHMPELVEVSKPASVADTIVQKLYKARKSDADKREDLRKLLNGLTDVKNAIVFANRKRTVGIIEKSMQKHGFNAAGLHGDMDQQSRLKTLEAFRNNEITYLIASDVAARGLDIPDVSHVINYDVPIHAEDYVHRIGRTGRAGRKGEAVMLVTPPEKKALAAIEKLIEKSIDWQGKAIADDSADEKPRERKGRKPKKAETTKTEPKTTEAKTAEAKTAGDEKKAEPTSRRKKGRTKSVYDEVGTVSDSSGFHDGNMPSFLANPLIAGSGSSVKPKS